MKKIYFLIIALCVVSISKGQIINFPDANFKAKLLAASSSNTIAKNSAGQYFKIDINDNSEIEIDEAQLVVELNIANSLISSLNGIHNFTNLTLLICGGNSITNLDVTGNVNLTHLYCQYNSMLSLNASSLPNLVYLNCGNNSLTSLSVLGSISLYEIMCESNSLTSLNITGLTNLGKLNCNSNNLQSLDASNLINLTELNCFNNQIAFLNLNGLINLSYLNCPVNELANLNLSGLNNLSTIYCGLNNLVNLDVSTLSNLVFLNCGKNQLTNLNVSGLSNLIVLECNNNNLTTINLSGLSELGRLDFSNNDISSIDFSPVPQLTNLFCNNNLLTSFDNTLLPNLVQLWCTGNDLTALDVSNMNNLNAIYCYGNQLQTLNLKNGKNESVDMTSNYNLQYVCADETQVASIQSQLNANCVLNSYCTFVPGGVYYSIEGNAKLDDNNNGCDVFDFNCSNLKFTITGGATAGSLFADSMGDYLSYVQSGSHTLTPFFENPTYFTTSPSNLVVNFPTQISPFTQNFCIQANGVHPDLEVALLPTVPARPGFDAIYKLIYKNKGTNIQSGVLNLSFNDAVLDFVSASPVITNQAINNISWNFTNLQPFETREIALTLNLNSPMEVPAVNGGDILNYTTTITSAATDETPADNTFTLNQTVVNSYDPNDKTCLEGAVISPSEVGKYVHYVIRFENTGTYPAENIAVKDIIDTSKFDINSLVPLRGSHSFKTTVTSGNKVQFIFENINLPFDDANNDGYVAFKIKTKPTLVVGNTFSNSASIYFDYNFPIVTNTATTTVQTLGTQDFDFNTYFALYPNPVKNSLNVETKQTITVSSISIYNQLGQLVVVVPNAVNVKTIDVSSLSTGNYFIKVNTDKGISNSKFIKQ